jgi:hypothetical protein
MYARDGTADGDPDRLRHPGRVANRIRKAIKSCTRRRSQYVPPNSSSRGSRAFAPVVFRFVLQLLLRGLPLNGVAAGLHLGDPL